MENGYIPRLADAELERSLRRQGGVLIQGPKGCGKTETAKQQAASFLNVETDPGVTLAMDNDPRLLLEGATSPHRRMAVAAETVGFRAARH